VDQINKYAKLLREVRKEHENRPTDINDRILIVDGMNTYIRVFSAVPTLNEDGLHVGGISGFLKSIGALIRTYKPTRCVIVFDGQNGSAKRKKLHPGYKEGRSLSMNFNRVEGMDFPEGEMDSMARQFARLSQYLGELPITTICMDYIEADDVIAYITNDLHPQSESIIVSNDKDFLQLVNDKVRVWNPGKKKLYSPKEILDEYGVPAHNFIHWKIFKGDSSDKIPGIKGVGNKTITEKLTILKEDRPVTIDEIVKFCETKRDEAKVFKTISESKEQMEFSHTLMQLKDLDFSGTQKLQVGHHMDKAMTRSDIRVIRSMLMSDRMYTAIPNLETWIRNSFSTLDSYVK